MNNVVPSDRFTKPFFTPEDIAQVGKEASLANGEFLSVMRNGFTTESFGRFITETSVIGNVKITRSELFLLLLNNSCLSSKFPILSEEQREFLSSKKDLRVKYLCRPSQKASKSDKIIMFLRDHDLLELIERANESSLVKISEKFFLLYCLHYLKKQRIELVNDTIQRKMTENDFKARMLLESKIEYVEAELKKYKSKKKINSNRAKAKQYKMYRL